MHRHTWIYFMVLNFRGRRPVIYRVCDCDTVELNPLSKGWRFETSTATSPLFRQQPTSATNQNPVSSHEQGSHQQQQQL